MNSRINEDLAWLRVQDNQREAENRRLMAGQRSPGMMRALGRLIVRSLAGAWSRRPATQSEARPTIETRHHA
jgi:hypothetical protein